METLFLQAPGLGPGLPRRVATARVPVLCDVAIEGGDLTRRLTKGSKSDPALASSAAGALHCPGRVLFPTAGGQKLWGGKNPPSPLGQGLSRPDGSKKASSTMARCSSNRGCRRGVWCSERNSTGCPSSGRGQRAMSIAWKEGGAWLFGHRLRLERKRTGRDAERGNTVCHGIQGSGLPKTRIRHPSPSRNRQQKAWTCRDGHGGG